MKQLTGQLPVQGDRPLLRDMLISEATKIIPYLNFIQDKEMVINAAMQSYTSVKEALNMKPIDTTKNTINFLNTLSEEELRTIGIKDKTRVITWARKVVGKHQLIEIVQAKIDIMLHQIKTFKASFVPLFQKGMPSFWEEDGRLMSQAGYQALLVKSRLDHRKFEDMIQ